MRIIIKRVENRGQRGNFRGLAVNRRFSIDDSPSLEAYLLLIDIRTNRFTAYAGS